MNCVWTVFPTTLGIHSLKNRNNNYAPNAVLGLEYKDEYNTTYTIL